MTHDAPILANEPIGPNQALTPEGFLLCRDVPIARTGVMVYGEGEIPVEALGGIIHVTRTDDEVFSPSAMASFEGKPVTNLHPPALVTPASWREYVVGTVTNVRRMDSRLVADLLIADAGAIKEIQSGLREVSCGYDASYEQTAPGEATQREIVGNHVALVPKGRCGPTCAIGDKKPEENRTMRKSFKDRILAAFRTKDEEAMKTLLDEGAEGGDVHIHLGDEPEDPTEKRFRALEDAIKGLAADKGSKDDFNDLVDKLVKKGYSKEEATKIAGKVAVEKGDDAARDDNSEVEGGEKANREENKEDPDRESYSGDSLPVLRSRAEILSPGIRLSFPTGDAKSVSYKKTASDCKRQALKAAYATDDGRAAVDSILSGRCVDTLSPATLDAVFMGAAAVIGAKNNGSTGSQAKRTTKDFGIQAKISDINKANQEFWAARSK